MRDAQKHQIQKEQAHKLSRFKIFKDKNLLFIWEEEIL